MVRVNTKAPTRRCPRLAPGGRQRPGPHRSPGRFTEMSVYLGPHKEVDADKLVTDLWPEDSHI